MSTVDWILRQIRDQIGQDAKSSLKSYAPLAIADADNFLLGLEPDLTQWMTLLAAKDIDLAQFRSLVEDRAVIAQMAALQHAGLAQANIEAFRRRFVDVIVNALTGTDSPGPAAAL